MKEKLLFLFQTHKSITNILMLAVSFASAQFYFRPLRKNDNPILREASSQSILKTLPRKVKLWMGGRVGE